MVCTGIHLSGTANTKSQISQGNLHHRLLHPRWRCQGTQDTNEEPDINHLLRSRGNIRRHHVHRLLRKVKNRRRGGRLLSRQSVHGVRAILVRPHGGHVQLDMWCLRGNQRE